MATYASVIDAVSANDLNAARDILLAEVKETTKNRNSWDCPHYNADRSIQEGIKITHEFETLATYFGLENLRDRYSCTVLMGRFVRIFKNSILASPLACPAVIVSSPSAFMII